jgi:putative Holliday junction resolvase
MRILGLDVGSVRVGVALSDEDGIIASPLDVIEAEAGEVVAAIGALCNAHGVQQVVVGLPLSMSGGERGDSARRAKALGKALAERLDVDIVFRDERFSTAAADRSLIGGNVRRAHRKDVVDKVAAALILQGYLDEQRTAQK